MRKEFRPWGVLMLRACKVLVIAGLLASSSLSSVAQASQTRNIVLPNPQLIHCRLAECSRLWKQLDGDGEAFYPAQVLTDVVNGEIVGLTAVYDKSVSTMEIRDAFNTLYGKWQLTYPDDNSKTRLWLWGVKPEQLSIQLSERNDGTKQVVYLKFGTFSSHVPSAHIQPDKGCR